MVASKGNNYCIKIIGLQKLSNHIPINIIHHTVLAAVLLVRVNFGRTVFHMYMFACFASCSWNSVCWLHGLAGYVECSFTRWRQAVPPIKLSHNCHYVTSLHAPVSTCSHTGFPHCLAHNKFQDFPGAQNYLPRDTVIVPSNV